MRIALTAAAATRTSADATANVPRVTALGTAQVTDAQALATANTAQVTAQQAAQVTLVQATMEATDAQADADAGVADTAVETVDAAEVTEADSLASDGATWVTSTEDADDDADEAVASKVDTLSVAIAQAAANYQVAQAGAAASAAAATQSATPSAANLFASQYAAAGYQWAQLFAPQFVSFAQTSADGDKQDETDDDEADKTLVGDLAQHEQTYEDATAQFDADDATTDAEAEIEDARQTTHNDDAYAISAAQADKLLAVTTAGAQGVDGVAIAQADATEQLEMAQAGVGAPTTAMQTEYNTSIENAKLTLATTQAGADIIWTGSYTTAGVSDGEADLAADAQDATTEATADSHDMQHDADAAKSANDDDVDSEFTDAGSMLTDSTTDTNTQIGAQETLWSNAAGDNVTALTTLNTTVGTPLTQYLLDRANAETTWTAAFDTQFNSYAASVLGAATMDINTDALLAKNDAKNDASATDIAINAIAGDLLADTDVRVGAMQGYSQLLGSPINGYSGSVANARSQYAIDLAVAQHDYDLGGSQANYQAALQTALNTENGSLRSAAVDYAMSELGPDAQATQIVASEDLNSAATIDQVIDTMQTTIDANDKSANLAIDTNDQTFALSAASFAEAFTQSTSASYDIIIDNLATTDSSAYSIQAAAIADALNLQTQSGAVATYNQSVAAANATWTLANTTDMATAAVNDALAANNLAADNSSALSAYNQIMGQIAGGQATAAAGGYAALLPSIAMPPGMATAATSFTEIATVGRPAQDNFDNIGLGSPPTVIFSGQDAVSPAFYGGQSQLGEALPLGSTMNLVEHPTTLAAPAADNVSSVISAIANSPAQNVIRCTVEFVQGGLADGAGSSVQMVEMCFPAGTPVLTRGADGQRTFKSIEEIEIGDWVWSVPDHSPSSAGEWKQVDRIFHNPPAALIGVHLGDQVVRATHAHRFYVFERGWVPAGDLLVGDKLHTPSGELITVTDLFDNNEVEPVYNLRVVDNHTYFVGSPDNACAILVHNDYDDSVKSRVEVLHDARIALDALVKTGKISQDEADIRYETVKAAIEHDFEFNAGNDAYRPRSWTDDGDPEKGYHVDPNIPGNSPTNAIMDLWGYGFNLDEKVSSGCEQTGELIQLMGITMWAVYNGKAEALDKVIGTTDSTATIMNTEDGHVSQLQTRLDNPQGFKEEDLIPGDRVWLENPDFFKLSPEIQEANRGQEGGNFIYLGGGLYMPTVNNEDPDEFAGPLTLKEAQQHVSEFFTFPSTKGPADVNIITIYRPKIPDSLK